MEPEVKIVLQQEQSELIDKIKNKHGQVHSCSCCFNININEICQIQENIQLCKYMSMYIDEYILLCNQLISIKKELKNE